MADIVIKDRKVYIRDVKAIAETVSAILVCIDDEQFWIPTSQIDDDSEVYADGHEGTLVITEWIAERKEGLLDLAD